MSESSLADEFALQIAEGPYTKSKVLGAWAYQNRDRILAALRRDEEYEAQRKQMMEYAVARADSQNAAEREALAAKTKKK